MTQFPPWVPGAFGAAVPAQELRASESTPAPGPLRGCAPGTLVAPSRGPTQPRCPLVFAGRGCGDFSSWHRALGWGHGVGLDPWVPRVGSLCVYFLRAFRGIFATPCHNHCPPLQSRDGQPGTAQAAHGSPLLGPSPALPGPAESFSSSALALCPPLRCLKCIAVGGRGGPRVQVAEVRGQPTSNGSVPSGVF